MSGVELTPHQRNAIEISAALFIIVAVFAATFSRASGRFLRCVRQAFSAFARRKRLSVVALFFSVVVVRLLALPLLPVPVPGIHDEFNYLLIADTFVHARLANPPQLMWISTEIFHTNWMPTSSSKYPPAQGVVLAVGELLGNPWIGVLLSDAAMCAAILWMMQAWLPPPWALLGGVLVAVKFGLASYWMNSYWGGAVAAAAGALVLGSLARLLHRVRVRYGLTLGLGAAIVANSRPYEGFLFCIPVGVWFVWWFAGKTRLAPPFSTRLINIALPLMAILLATAAGMGFYNWRLTGKATLFPYVLNARTYESAGLFVWQHAGPERQYNNDQFEDFYNGFERDNYRNTWRDFRSVSLKKVTRYWRTYIWWGALLVLPGVASVFRDRKMRLPLAIFFLGVAGSLLAVWSMPHYSAPLTSVVFLLLIQAMRHVRKIQVKQRPLGLALCAAAAILLPFEVGTVLARHRCDPLQWTCQGDPSRAAIADTLNHTPGKHLIMVRYEEDHNIHDVWAFNGAEIDGAKVLWARELGPEQNAKLFTYFKDRQIWLVTPDTDNTFLEPYTPPPGQRTPVGH